MALNEEFQLGGIQMKAMIDTRRNTDKGTPMVADISLRTVAIVAGLGLLIMAIIAPISFFGIFEKLVVQGDATATASNILGSVGLFRIGTFCLLIVAILDMIVAWALNVLLKSVNRSLSLLMALFRVVFATIFVMALVNLVNILQLLNGADYLGGQVDAQVMLYYNSFKNGWDMGLIILGFHLAILGYLIFKSIYFPKFLGVLLVIASFGYVVDGFGKLFLPNYNLTISTVTFVGEALLIIWLLLRGIRGFNKSQKTEIY
jgi:hypothetical protein